MPISKGEPWGQPGPIPADAGKAMNDADLAIQVVASADPWIGTVASGDLLKTLGGVGEDGAPLSRADTHHFPVDLGWVRLDGGERRPFVAHVIAHRLLWRGEAAAVMNAAWMKTAWLGDLYLGPRGHPNDGLLDVTFGQLPWKQRFEARRRARSGTHLPHPNLSTKRARAWEHEFSGPTPVFIDGVSAGKARTLAVELDVDAFTLVV